MKSAEPGDGSAVYFTAGIQSTFGVLRSYTPIEYMVPGGCCEDSVSVQQARRLTGSVEHIGGDVAAVFSDLGQHGFVQPDVHFG